MALRRHMIRSLCGETVGRSEVCFFLGAELHSKNIPRGTVGDPEWFWANPPQGFPFDL